MISFVVTARNDGYAGDFVERMQTSLDTLSRLVDKYKLDIEYLVVKWNPPVGRPELSEVLKLPSWVRVVRVPNELHTQQPMSNRIQLFEFVAKNTGIRRAKGEFIVATNPDIVFSDAMVGYLASVKLSTDCYYRATRYDILVEGGRVVRANHPLCSIDYRNSSVGNIKKLAIACVVRVRYGHKPFTNASGDFLMMHRSNWLNLNGYPEIIGSDKHGRFHVDSFLLYMALSIKLKEVRLAAPIYHLEHERKSTTAIYSPLIDAIYQYFSTNQKGPFLFNGDSWASPVARLLAVNDDSWGLRQHDLVEVGRC